MRFRKSLLIVAMLVFMLMFGARSAFGCTAIIVGAGASADGSTMTTHTCDGGYDERLTIVPAADHAQGEMRPVYTGGGDSPVPPLVKVGEIPQVAHTYQYVNAAYPFMNENQVMMGESTIGGQKSLKNQDGWFQVWELQRVALERAKTAREAIQIMGSLAEQYGYCDSGECLTITDPKEAWVFEIYGAGPLKPGAVWVAERIPDGEVGVCCNRSRIGVVDFNDPDNFMYSSNIQQVAEDLDLWQPADGPLSVKAVYGPKSSYYNSRREWRVLSLIAPSLNLDPWADDFPFSVKPDKPVTVQQLMTINRDHYEGTPFDLTQGPAAGPFGTPDRYATSGNNWERAISIFRCAYSIVTQSRSWLPDAIGGVVWFGEDAPQTTVYMPLYAGMTEIPQSLQVGTRDVFDHNSAWWAFSVVSNWADLKYSYMIKDIQAAYGKFEGDEFSMQPTIEQAAQSLYDKDPQLAVQFLNNYCDSNINNVVDSWWKLFDTLACKYNDGYVDCKSVGYPQEWLDSVGYGPIQKPAN